MSQEERVRHEELEQQASEYIRFIEDMLEERRGFFSREGYDDALAKLDTAYLFAQTEETRMAAKHLAQKIKDMHRGT